MKITSREKDAILYALKLMYRRWSEPLGSSEVVTYGFYLPEELRSRGHSIFRFPKDVRRGLDQLERDELVVKVSIEGKPKYYPVEPVSLSDLDILEAKISSPIGPKEKLLVESVFEEKKELVPDAYSKFRVGGDPPGKVYIREKKDFGITDYKDLPEDAPGDVDVLSREDRGTYWQINSSISAQYDAKSLLKSFPEKSYGKFALDKKGNVLAGVTIFKGYIPNWRGVRDFDFSEEPGDVELDSLFRSPKVILRGTHKGLGKTLLSDVTKDLLKDKGTGRLVVVAAPGTLNFYKKLGFRRLGEESFVEGSAPVLALDRKGMEKLVEGMDD